jgi:hypothetical protein
MEEEISEREGKGGGLKCEGEWADGKTSIGKVFCH